MMFYPAVADTGTHIVTYVFTDASGCTGTDSIAITVDECLSLSQIQQQQIQLFPNPNNGTFTLRLPSEVQNARFNISDLAGSVVYSEVLMGQETEVETGLSPGVYLLNLFIDNQNITRKISVN